MDSLYWSFWFLVTLILYFITAGMFCRIWFLMDRVDWWSNLAELLVGFKGSTIPNPPTDRIFQTAMSVIILDVYLESFSGALIPLHGCWLNVTHILNIYNSLGSAFAYVFQHISLCWLAHLFTHKKASSGRQQPQSRSSWHLSGSPWHTKHKWFSVMEYAAIFLTWKPQLVYCMYFTAMERCYSYRELKTRYYWSNWLPFYSVSLVSLDHKMSGLELILAKVFSCLQAIFFQDSSDFTRNVLS